MEIDFKQRTAMVDYDPGTTDAEMLVAAVAASNVFEASVLPQSHQTGEALKGPDQQDQPKSNNGGI